jgi:hypothetical protein
MSTNADIRILTEVSPEARMAAVCVIVCRRIHDLHPGQHPDYADFRDALQKHIRREILLARLDEVLHVPEIDRAERSTELLAELAKLIYE